MPPSVPSNGRLFRACSIPCWSAWCCYGPNMAASFPDKERKTPLFAPSPSVRPIIRQKRTCRTGVRSFLLPHALQLDGLRFSSVQIAHLEQCIDCRHCVRSFLLPRDLQLDGLRFLGWQYLPPQTHGQPCTLPLCG